MSLSTDNFLKSGYENGHCTAIAILKSIHCHPYFKQKPSLREYIPLCLTATNGKNRLTQQNRWVKFYDIHADFSADSAVCQKHTHNNHVLPMLVCHVTFNVWRMTFHFFILVGKCTQRQLVVPEGWQLNKTQERYFFDLLWCILILRVLLEATYKGVF